MKQKLLRGMTVVNLGYNLPGPLAARQLADLGATVIKIEPPKGDPLQFASREFYKFLTKGQKIIQLNLKEKPARKSLREFLHAADVLITSSRPDSLARIQLDTKTLIAEHPKLCIVNIVGFSKKHNRSGHDLTYQAEAGLIQPPHLPVTCLADIAGAQKATAEALALLLLREKSGQAGFAQVALYDALKLYTLPNRYGLSTSNGPLGGARADYNIYRAKRGWVAIALLEPQFIRAFKKKLHISNLDRHVFEKAILQRTAREWQVWAAKNNLPIAALR